LFCRRNTSRLLTGQHPPVANSQWRRLIGSQRSGIGHLNWFRKPVEQPGEDDGGGFAQARRDVDLLRVASGASTG